MEDNKRNPASFFNCIHEEVDSRFSIYVYVEDTNGIIDTKTWIFFSF